MRGSCSSGPGWWPIVKTARASACVGAQGHQDRAGPSLRQAVLGDGILWVLADGLIRSGPSHQARERVVAAQLLIAARRSRTAALVGAVATGPPAPTPASVSGAAVAAAGHDLRGTATRRPHQARHWPAGPTPFIAVSAAELLRPARLTCSAARPPCTSRARATRSRSSRSSRRRSRPARQEQGVHREDRVGGGCRRTAEVSPAAPQRPNSSPQPSLVSPSLSTTFEQALDRVLVRTHSLHGHDGTISCS